jgi:hypothetical protein
MCLNTIESYGQPGESTASTCAVLHVCAALLPSASGQGYIWLAHRDPASPSWALARRSKAMWQQLAAAAGSSALGEAMEWQVRRYSCIIEDPCEIAALQRV